MTDGDTISIQKTQVRLCGIDAPELNHPYELKYKTGDVDVVQVNCRRTEITGEDDYGEFEVKDIRKKLGPADALQRGGCMFRGDLMHVRKRTADRVEGGP